MKKQERVNSVLFCLFFMIKIQSLSLKTVALGALAFTTASVYQQPIRASKSAAFLLDHMSSHTGLSFQNKYEKLIDDSIKRFPELSPILLNYALENSINPNKTSIFDKQFIEKHRHHYFASDYLKHTAEVYARNISIVPQQSIKECYALSRDFQTETSLDRKHVRNLFKTAVEKNLTTIPLDTFKIILENSNVQEIADIQETIIQKNQMQPFEQSKSLLELLKKQ